MASAADDRLGYLLKHAQLKLAELTREALAPWGVNGRELAVLTVLGGGDPLAQQQAADRLGVDRTTMVALVDELERKGLVERRADPADRRRNLVHLTGAGRRVLNEGGRAYATAEQRFSEHAEQLRELLRRALSEKG